MANATSDRTFQKDVLESEVPVLVDFWAEWCGPCRMLGPVIEKVGQKMEGRARVYKLNVDENPGVAQQYGITAIPTVIVFQNGQIKQQIVGVRPEAQYLDALN
ncbi:MAG: thioredoxin [Leptospiraceae bacterium]|nr:thioredoxin [Leptospiraceae bacterium]